ncbi:unnamed protein product [Moneuplotes crassus]|uniref:Uncharacterized protein n=1 Tax=Euplotes crassus TaxID=5936 RepID=A0AAD1ULL4_EUPCR|nr:unnamed protein product [Moneuplotes crassus]
MESSSPTTPPYNLHIIELPSSDQEKDLFLESLLEETHKLNKTSIAEDIELSVIYQFYKEKLEEEGSESLIDEAYFNDHRDLIKLISILGQVAELMPCLICYTRDCEIDKIMVMKATFECLYGKRTHLDFKIIIDGADLAYLIGRQQEHIVSITTYMEANSLFKEGLNETERDLKRKRMLQKRNFDDFLTEYQNRVSLGTSKGTIGSSALFAKHLKAPKLESKDQAKRISQEEEKKSLEDHSPIKPQEMILAGQIDIEEESKLPTPVALLTSLVEDQTLRNTLFIQREAKDCCISFLRIIEQRDQIDLTDIFLTLSSVVNQNLQNTEEFKTDPSRREIFLSVCERFLFKEIITSTSLLQIFQILKSCAPAAISQERTTSLLNELAPVTAVKFSAKDHKLKGDIKLYACVIYPIVKKLIIKTLYDSEQLPRTVKELIETIFIILKNFYNSRDIHKDQKNLIKRDRRIKFLVAEVLRIKSAWVSSGENFSIRVDKIAQLRDRFQTQQSSDTLTEILEDLKVILDI